MIQYKQKTCRPEKLSTSRASILNPVVVSKYFDDLGSLLDKLGLQEKPHLLWNCDETGQSFEHSPVRVIAEKSSRNVLGRTSNTRTNVTIMACINAAGKSRSPMFITKEKMSASIHGFNTSAAPVGSKWTFQENGWMSDKLGEQWFMDIFLKECGDERPQVLLLDGHFPMSHLPYFKWLLKTTFMSCASLPIPHTFCSPSIALCSDHSVLPITQRVRSILVKIYFTQ